MSNLTPIDLRKRRTEKERKEKPPNPPGFAAGACAKHADSLGRKHPNCRACGTAGRPTCDTDGPDRHSAACRTGNSRDCKAAWCRCACHVEEIVTDLVKRGPALGFIPMVATQRPDDKSIPKPISDNAVLRACLRVMSSQANNMVLGPGAYGNGYRATMFTIDDKGIMWLLGEGAQPQITKAHGYSNLDAVPIVARARVMRQAAGRTTGYAAGVEDDQEVRSFAADVLSIFGDDEDKLWIDTIADRLADRLEFVYADINATAVASQLRGLGVRLKKVREPGREPKIGCERSSVKPVL